MNRRTRAQHKTDDLAFPVRVKFAVPWNGLGAISSRLQQWLSEELGPGRYASHTAMAISTQAIGVYFVSLEDAQRFVAAFPEMEIADGTRSASYYSPARR